MKANTRIHWRRWVLIITTAAALAGGAAYAMNKECWTCTPCGCGADGGYLMCCDVNAC